MVVEVQERLVRITHLFIQDFAESTSIKCGERDKCGSVEFLNDW